MKQDYFWTQGYLYAISGRLDFILISSLGYAHHGLYSPRHNVQLARDPKKGIKIKSNLPEIAEGFVLLTISLLSVYYCLDYSDISIYMCKFYLLLIVFFVSSLSLAGARGKRTISSKSSEFKAATTPVVDRRSVDQRAFNATLWIDQIKAPITTGHVLFIDSLFAVFKPKKILNINDVHTNVILQIHEQGTLQGSRAAIVDYDLQSGWMLVELRKQEIIAPKQKISENEVVDMALRLKLIENNEQGMLFSAIKKFEENTHLRGIAGEKSFPEMLEIQLKNYGDRLVQTLLKSQRKMSWNQKTTMPLPLVDTCETDSILKKNLQTKTAIKSDYNLRCYSIYSGDREPASSIRPSYEVYTGIFETDEPYLKIQNVAGQVDFLHEQILEAHPDLVYSPAQCLNNWISDRNIFVKSCIERNNLFKGLYDGVHTFGFYHDKKIIYKTISIRALSDSNQKEIVKKFLNEMKGNVL